MSIFFRIKEDLMNKGLRRPSVAAFPLPSKGIKEDLMNKGLRRPQAQPPAGTRGIKEDLMNKGLRPSCWFWFAEKNSGIKEDLMNKGLRLLLSKYLFRHFESKKT